MRLGTITVDLHTFSLWSLGFEIGTWYLLVSFLKWSLEISFKKGE